MSVFPGVTAARLPAAGLSALAGVRDVPGVRVHPGGERAWVTWPADRPEVATALMGVFGAELFVRRCDHWHRFGSRLPTADAPPAGDGLSLPAVVGPARFVASPPPADVPTVAVRLVRGGPPRPASALLCRLADLRDWVETALTAELTAVHVARSGDRLAVLGDRLPAGGARFWGDRLLVPLGLRPDPDLPPGVLLDAAGAGPDDLVFLTDAGADRVPRAAFAPATRAGLRLAGRT